MVRLYAPKSYYEASQDERDAICNGCGPKKAFFGWLVPDTLWGLAITEACNIHDWMYASGRWMVDREQADKTFLDNMYLLIEADKSSSFKRMVRRRMARRYYYACRMFGNPYFTMRSTIALLVDAVKGDRK